MQLVYDLSVLINSDYHRLSSCVDCLVASRISKFGKLSSVTSAHERPGRNVVLVYKMIGN